MSEPLRLLHLSDIHFSFRDVSAGFDPDEDIRGELIRDVKKMVAMRGPVKAIVISGDIAFSGKKAEYENASHWLDKLCNEAQCELESVYVCPGNHDVDRDVIQKNITLQDVQDAVLSRDTDHARDSALKRRLDGLETRNLIYSPLSEFNEFAARYECSFYGDAESYAWNRDLQLNDGSLLRIRGLNSALFSGPSDSEGSLFLGVRAYTMPRHDGIEYLAVSHHPPSWVMDRKQMENALADRARIHLFGHEHDQRVVPGRDYITLYAGAINPNRSEPNWYPGYNMLEISIETNGKDRIMVVTTHAREWQQRTPTQFRAYLDRNGSDTHVAKFQLSPWERTKPEVQMAEDKPSPEQNEQPKMSRRELVNRFFRLPISKKNQIVGGLNLIEEQDKALPDVERYKRAFGRAIERDVMRDFELRVLEAEKGI